jgi:hypothetical protein
MIGGIIIMHLKLVFLRTLAHGQSIHRTDEREHGKRLRRRWVPRMAVFASSSRKLWLVLWICYGKVSSYADMILSA